MTAGSYASPYRLALGLLEVGQVGPVLLPVVGAQLLARHFSVKMALKGKTVVRRERAKVVRPGPYVAAVLIAEDAGHFYVTTRHVQDLEVCGYLFHDTQSNLNRPVSQTTLDPFICRCLP